MIMEEDNRRRIYYREDWEYIHNRLTIEQQLQFYERRPEGNERAATLWHAWHQNKQWLIRLLELTLASFPSYSRHDSSHADAVVHNIERILGEKGSHRCLQQTALPFCTLYISTISVWQF